MLYANNISDVHFQADDDSSSGYVQSTPYDYPRLFSSVNKALAFVGPLYCAPFLFFS